MTNEKTIEILKELWRYSKTDKYSESEIRKAIKNAIKAVEAVDYDCAECKWYLEVKKNEMSKEDRQVTDGDSIPRQAVITMLNKIENAVEDGDGFQFNEWIDYAKDIPSAEKTTINSKKTTITDGDLIRREYTIQQIQKAKENNYNFNYDTLIDFIKVLPSAEKTAKWIWKEGRMGIDYCHCSKCGGGQWEMEFPYCPNCGSRMKGME